MKHFCSILLLLVLPFTGTTQTQQRLFSLLPSEKTGVTFENTITDEKAHNILIYSNYYGGAGVGIGDFNNDGLDDLYFTGNLVGDRLYKNNGDLVFEDITKQAAGILDDGSWSSGVAIADVNNDGLVDIYVCKELYDDKPALRRNKLYINKGNFTFEEKAAEYGLDNDQRTRHATFLDYNKDGFLDLFILNQPPNPGNYSELYGINWRQPRFSPRLYRNNGNGSFTDVSETAGVLKPCFPNSVSASDFNNDGWTDIYVANDFEAPDLLYINQGDGTFVNIIEEASRHISYFSMGVDAADINNDGWLDLMVLDMIAEDNYRLKANMSGMDPEAFWKTLDEGGHYQYMHNTLLLNNGNNVFSDIAHLAGVSSTDWSWANLIADFDNDGLRDIYVTNGLLRDIRNSDAAKTFPAYVQKTIDEFIRKHPNKGNVSIWDILDLDEALALLPSVKLSNYMFRNKDGLVFEKVMEDWGIAQKTFSNGAAYSDLDKDGDLDLVVNNINEVAHIYRNNAEKVGANNFLRVRLHDSKHKVPVLNARLKIDYAGKQQIFELTSVRGIYSTSECAAHFGLGQHDKIDVLTITWPNKTTTVLKDLETNQLLDIDYRKYKKQPAKPQAVKKQYHFEDVSDAVNIDFCHRENDFDDFDKQVLLPHRLSTFGPAVAVGDVNGDQLEDFYAGGAKGQQGQLFVQTEDGTFKKSEINPWNEDKEKEDVKAVFFDIDNDGDNDLYVVSGGNAYPANSEMYQDRLYINMGKGTFVKAPDLAIPRLRESGGCVVPFDFDNDGDKDLFVGTRHWPWKYPSPTTSRILENNDGRLKDITKEIAPDLLDIGMVTDAIWSDFDQDGRVDLMVVGEWMPVTILKFDGKKFKRVDQSLLDKNAGWWFSIEAADFDKDGDEDYIIGNLGQNHKYNASEHEPFEIYYSDFDENGTGDIVLSHFNFGERVPVRGRSCSSQQVPTIKNKFQTYDLFASADLDKIYGVNELDQALHYQVPSFASIYLENLGDGKFRTRTLPVRAQFSPVNAIVIDDFNKDGHLDVLLGGNFYATEVETTRHDAGVGLLLTGDGKGNFKAISPLESGLLIPYDVKELSIIHVAKEKYILCASNNDKLRLLKWED